MATTLKRKLNEDSDVEDELFFQFESEKKKKSLPDDDDNVKDDESKKESEKENTTNVEETKESKPVTESLKSPSPKKEILKVKNSPAVVASPSNDVTKKSMVQTKISFGKPATDSPKSAVKKTEKVEPSLPSVPIDTGGEWKIQNYLTDDMWRRLLKDELEKKYFVEINKVLEAGYAKNIVRPPKELVFNALNSTKISDIKVVIIGQDPYHDDNQAHGLCFSVQKGIPLPPSLKNIFTELKNDIPEFERDPNLGGCLQKWCEQGVFLLNACLTVEAHKPNSHAKIGWDAFTDRVIKLVSEKNNGCVFMLWGAFAQKKEAFIDKKKHKILKCGHPSPFSVTRFYGSKCFSQANTYLKSIGKTPINWSLKN